MGKSMIIGNGLLAQAFKEYTNNDDVIVFASGVSNSKETLQSEFLREENLLKDTMAKFGENRKLIYFSTCSIYDKYFEMSEYTKHKIKMEERIIKNAVTYNIFRLPQVLGKNNKNQLIGFLYEQIKNKKNFDLFDIERNIIDIEDVYLIVGLLLQENIKNEIINIANITNIKVTKLVETIEKICSEKAIYCMKKIDGSFNIDISKINELVKNKNIFESNYLENRIRKYYE